MNLSRFSLGGKVALVTGGSRGIGKATALGFAEAGADVVVTSRKLSDLEEVADEIKILGRRSLAVSAHLGRMDQIDDLVSKVTEEFDRIDILVNNAGTSPVYASVLDVEERAWDAIMNLNLKGLFFLSRTVAKTMKEQGGGTIINVASMDGLKPEPNIGIYAISKAGVIMATKVMALELAKFNIKVNAIAPGNVSTRLGDSRWDVVPGYQEEMLRRIPVGRIGKPSEMVSTMIYLACDASSYTTGDTILVDGGVLLS